MTHHREDDRSNHSACGMFRPAHSTTDATLVTCLFCVEAMADAAAPGVLA